MESKFAPNKLTPRWGDYSGQWNHEVLKSGGEAMWECYSVRRTQCTIGTFEDERGNHKTRNMTSSRMGKGKRNDFHPSPSPAERMWSGRHIWPCETHADLWPTKLYYKFVLFQAFNFSNLLLGNSIKWIQWHSGTNRISKSSDYSYLTHFRIKRLDHFLWDNRQANRGQ